MGKREIDDDSLITYSLFLETILVLSLTAGHTLKKSYHLSLEYAVFFYLLAQDLFDEEECSPGICYSFIAFSLSKNLVNFVVETAKHSDKLKTVTERLDVKIKNFPLEKLLDREHLIFFGIVWANALLIGMHSIWVDLLLLGLNAFDLYKRFDRSWLNFNFTGAPSADEFLREAGFSVIKLAVFFFIIGRILSAFSLTLQFTFLCAGLASIHLANHVLYY